MRESQKKAIKKYKEKVKRLTLEFSPTESELLEHINKQPKKQTYIKDLIRKDMKQRKHEPIIEPIIDEKTFAEVQEKLNNKKK